MIKFIFRLLVVHQSAYRYIYLSKDTNFSVDCFSITINIFYIHNLYLNLMKCYKVTYNLILLLYFSLTLKHLTISWQRPYNLNEPQCKTLSGLKSLLSYMLVTCLTSLMFRELVVAENTTSELWLKNKQPISCF